MADKQLPKNTYGIYSDDKGGVYMFDQTNDEHIWLKTFLVLSPPTLGILSLVTILMVPQPILEKTPNRWWYHLYHYYMLYFFAALWSAALIFGVCSFVYWLFVVSLGFRNTG